MYRNWNKYKNISQAIAVNWSCLLCYAIFELVNNLLSLKTINKDWYIEINLELQSAIHHHFFN